MLLVPDPRQPSLPTSATASSMACQLPALRPPFSLSRTVCAALDRQNEQKEGSETGCNESGSVEPPASLQGAVKQRGKSKRGGRQQARKQLSMSNTKGSHVCITCVTGEVMLGNGARPLYSSGRQVTLESLIYNRRCIAVGGACAKL